MTASQRGPGRGWPCLAAVRLGAAGIRSWSPSNGPCQRPLWYKDAIIYQTQVKAFYDRDGDGIGDFRGLTAKLDYARDLGANAI